MRPGGVGNSVTTTTMSCNDINDVHCIILCAMRHNDCLIMSGLDEVPSRALATVVVADLDVWVCALGNPDASQLICMHAVGRR